VAKFAKIREKDLKPYQTHFLFQSSGSFTSQSVGILLGELPSIIDQGSNDEEERCEVLQQPPPRKINGEIIAWLVYRRAVPVKWAAGPEVPRDIEHHLVVLTARRTLLSVVTTDKTLGTKLSRSGPIGRKWSALNRIPPTELETTLVHGTTRTLWLSGIHRSVATKPDSKVLIGPDVEASLDALGDQTYEYTSTRCEGPEGALPAPFVGVTPRLAKVWLGPSLDWEVFLANTQGLLGVIGSPPIEGSTPYPILARAHASLRDVKDAFDVSLAPPEYLYDEDPNVVRQLEELLHGAGWSVRPKGGPNCVLMLQLGERVHELKISLNLRGDKVLPTVTPTGKGHPEEVEKIAELCRRADLLKIFYESLHTYSGGQIFEVKTRPVSFPLTACDFSGCDIKLEKPQKLGQERIPDLGRIGEAGEPSLFTWVWNRFKEGWLWCDDGSGEIADFIHLSPDRTVLSLIHVKAAHSKARRRGISVSAYEVVCSQALKNLRYTERGQLEQPLKEKLQKEANLVRGWHNGQELPPRSTQFWSAIAGARYSKLRRRIVIVQPHVRKSAIPENLWRNTRAARQVRLLFTLLHGIKADVNRYEVEFEVLVDQ
jgi:hypothetical protein